MGLCRIWASGLWASVFRVYGSGLRKQESDSAVRRFMGPTITQQQQMVPNCTLYFLNPLQVFGFRTDGWTREGGRESWGHWG